MTSYYVQTLRCLRCCLPFVATETSSHNTFGASFYTDGFATGPMYDPASALVACPSCGAVAWRDQFELMDRTRDFDWSNEAKGPKLKWASPIYGQRYVQALDDSMFRNASEEEYLRMQAWWHWNSPRRPSAAADIPMSTEERNNLTALRDLLLRQLSRPSTMLAEIARELGEFEVCMSEIAAVPEDKLDPVLITVLQLAEAGISKVAPVSFGK